MTKIVRVRMGEPRADTQPHLERVSERASWVRMTVLRLIG